MAFDARFQELLTEAIAKRDALNQVIWALQRAMAVGACDLPVEEAPLPLPAPPGVTR